MGFLTIYQDNYTDSTVISNRFIDEYMQSANDAQLKIYLYLIRMMSARLGTSISDIADKFNYTEKDVLRALKYWEKQRLLTLDCDEQKNITGIHLMDSNAGTDMLAITTGAESAALSTYPSAPAQVQNAYEKPHYTADQLQAFKSSENSARLLFVAEQYLKKPLSVEDVRTIFFIMDRLGFSEDLTDYLLQYCVDRGKRDFRYIEKVAISWAQQGIDSPKQAASLAGKYERSYYEIMRALGKNSVPTDAEAAYIERWLKTYGFETDVILDACERTVLATDSHRFEYAESILKRWYSIGVHHKNDIKALDADHRKAKTARRQSSANQFNRFAQNDYDFDALEKEILSN
ncbi:MAG: DnaD domain protein [Bacteroidales bacterium]|nr:DnaD domain protein [Bacteroidales bacterium]MCM1416950.1 DnaD domain protein [bacterium]MCM1424914.1 DnaD domain protein [bacterium]